MAAHTSHELLTESQLIDRGLHPRALVAASATIGKGVAIAPNASVGPDVTLADGVKVGIGAVITGTTTVGENTEVHSYATLGTPPQDLKYAGEKTRLTIGKNNQIREYVNISIGTVTGRSETVIGDDNLIMAYCHVAHDCIIANHCILANGVHLAGHVEVEDRVVFGGMSGGHQFCRFGEFAMVGAGSIVVMDVAPYVRVQGDRSTVRGINVIGISRGGFSPAEVKEVKTMYRMLFKQNLTLDDSIAKIRAEVADGRPKERMLSFLGAALGDKHRGLCR